MERISAAENITIEVSSDRWRMMSNGASETNVLFEVETGKPLNYITDFARTRRLPQRGMLPVNYVQRVVLGWSDTDKSWHLGLLLESELAKARGSRWCEMARWVDPSTTRYNEVAERAGQSLANITTRPFYLVPPETVKSATAPTRPLPDLPLTFDDLWVFDQLENESLQLVRKPRWARAVVRRILWYALWTAVFIFLVVANLTSGIAPANPAFLPLLGMFAAMVLAGLIGKNLYRLFTEPNRFVIDVPQRQIRAERGSSVRWSYRPEQLQAVYVSQLVNRRKLRREQKPATFYGEINLHLTSGKFQRLITVEQVEEYRVESEGLGNDDSVIMLDNINYTTSLQAVGLYMARRLDVPAMYDRRLQ